MKRLNNSMVYLILFCIAICISLLSAAFRPSFKSGASDALKTGDFDPALFKHPPLKYAPFTRWWWPGNDVTKEELKREVDLFADHHFGGVEIQPFALIIPVKGGKPQQDRITGYDSPEYYDNLRTVLDEANKKGLTVDLTDGSGWPAGGPHLTEEDNNLTLEFGTTNLQGGKTVDMAIPRPVRGDRPTARLQVVMAAKTLKDNADQPKESLYLDSSSAIDLTDFVQDNRLRWNAPAGTWKVVAFWGIPDGEKPSIVAKKDAGYVMNHWDSTKVLKNYNYLFGDRTGLASYFGHPLRAIFDDSYEFRANRNYSWDFLDYFKEKRGYDARKWLGANMQLGYNNMYARMSAPNAPFDIVFSDEDWRLRYDYDLTLSELLGKHFLDASRHWTESRGLLHRTQTYGFNMDMIASAGLASIPETETMMEGSGSEGAMKLITSGAHLYNKPVTSAESAVFINRAFMTTPQKLRLVADKLFAVGVNQMIFHGTSYTYHPEGYAKEGWYPWTNNVITGINFSSNISESDPFWKYQTDINQYIARTQYALRTGKPHADVLIYYPFLNFDDGAVNSEEILTGGYLKGIEPTLPVAPTSINKRTPQQIWYEKVSKLINKLEASGVSWEWVNDASIQEAELNANKQIEVRGNVYQTLVLGDIPFIQLKSAARINTLVKKGMKLLTVGPLPEKQPGFLNFQENDKTTKALIGEAATAKNSLHVDSSAGFNKVISGLSMKIKYAKPYDFVRTNQRDLADGSRIQYIWNKSDRWQKISIGLDPSFACSYWLNAEDGSITQNHSRRISYLLPPYCSRLLYASTKKVVSKSLLSAPKTMEVSAAPVLTINKWNIKADTMTVSGSQLFDWKDNPLFKFQGTKGVYNSSFKLNKERATNYYLDLGKVYFTADVWVNGKAAGTLLYAPYRMDITPFVIEGENRIQITVTTTQLNYFIGLANGGDKLYKQFKGQENRLMSAGLAGPVTVYRALNQK